MCNVMHSEGLTRTGGMELLPKPKCKKMNQVLFKAKNKKYIYGEGHQITPVLRVKQVAELQNNTIQNAPKLIILRAKINFLLGGGTAPSPGGERTPPPHTVPSQRLWRLDPRACGASSSPTCAVVN